MTIVYGLLGLGLIIFIHELGHFISARVCGVEVEAFSIGMGPVLLHKKIGKTDYRLSLIPLGGYCSMKGEKAFQEALDLKLSEIPREPHSFYGVHPLKRALIAFSGPFFNLFFAFAALSIIAMFGFFYYTSPNRIILATEVYADIDSSAAEAGLKTGDWITNINGKPIAYFSDISEIVSLSPKTPLNCTVKRDETTLNFTLIPKLETATGAGKIGILNWIDTTISSVIAGSNAEKAGLVAGDHIIEAAGYPVQNTVDFQKIIQNRTNIDIRYKRGDTVSAANLLLTKTDKGIETGIRWKIEKVTAKNYSFFPALLQGAKETFKLFTLTLKSIALLFQGIDLTKAISGPIGITMMLGETAKVGFTTNFSTGVIAVLNFLAIISISLFLMNLLPIPILDGSLIFFALLEFIRGKGLKPSFLYKIQFIGISLIAILFILGLFSDINRIIQNLTGHL